MLGQAVKSDPAALADEAGAISLFGGKRAIWIEPAGDEIAEGVEALLEAAGMRKPGDRRGRRRCARRRRCSSSPRRIRRRCRTLAYVPEGRDLERIVAELGAGGRAAHRAGSGPAHCGGRQPATRRSRRRNWPSSRFILAPIRPIRAISIRETVDLLGADSAEADLMRLGDLALAGRMDELLDELGRLPHGGSEAIPILRALQRRLLMLAPLRARVERGERVDGVMTSMGKALFWKDKPLIQRLLVGLVGRAAGGSRGARFGAGAADHAAPAGRRGGAWAKRW